MSGTKGLEEVVRLGSEEARANCQGHLLPEMLWVAVCRVDDPMLSRAFEDQKLDRQQFRRHLRALAASKAQILKPVSAPDIKIAQDCFHVLKQARRRAEAEGRQHPEPLDLLEELTTNIDADVDEVLR